MRTIGRMPKLTLAAAMQQYRDSIFAPMRATEPDFTPPADLVEEVDEAFYRALANRLRHLSPGKWTQFVMLKVSRDTARIDRLLAETTSNPVAVLQETLAALRTK